MSKGLNELKKNCSGCSNYIQKKINSCEEWEVNRKEFWQKELETTCLHACSHEGTVYSRSGRKLMTDAPVCKCGMGNPNYGYNANGGDLSIVSECEKCHKGQIKSKTYGNETGFDKDESTCNNPNCGKESKDRERERESILNYFRQHNIKSIKIKDNKLVIKYNHREEEEEEAKSVELQQIKSFTEKLGRSELSLTDLEQMSNQSPNSNKALYIGLAVVGAIIAGWLLLRNKKKNK